MKKQTAPTNADKPVPASALLTQKEAEQLIERFNKLLLTSAELHQRIQSINVGLADAKDQLATVRKEFAAMQPDMSRACLMLS